MPIVLDLMLLRRRLVKQSPKHEEKVLVSQRKKNRPNYQLSPKKRKIRRKRSKRNSHLLLRSKKMIPINLARAMSLELHLLQV